MKEKISIVVPCYNEEETIPYFYQEMQKITHRLEQKYQVATQIIFVDDGSKDNTLKVVKNIADKDDNIKYISFSRNFGKEAGLLAGLEYAEGDFVAVMDVDLQDPPELLYEMYEKMKEKEIDCVAARRTTRKGEPPIRSLCARLFYKGINKISKTEIVDGARDFRLMSRRMVNAILEMKEYNRFSKGIFGWVGFETEWLEYTNTERVAGKTKWSFYKLLIYAIDGVIAFSTAPLVIATVIGVLFSVIAFLMIIVFIVKTLIFGDPVAGYPSLVCIIFFIAGIQLFCMGIIGQYLSKAYLEIKGRPIYIVKESNYKNNMIK